MTASYNQSYGAGSSVFYDSGIRGWHLKSQTPTKSMSIDNIARGDNGHYLTNSRHVGGKQSQYTEVWEPDGDSSTLQSLEIGDINNETCVESASLRCTQGRPELTITGHVHETKEDNAARHIGDTFTCEFAFPTGAYGTVNPFPGAGIDSINDYEITESTQTFSVNHIDEPGRSGEFLVGASRGVVRTGQMNLTTANTVALGVKTGTGWAITNTTSPATNEGVVKQTVTGTKYISTESGGD